MAKAVAEWEGVLKQLPRLDAMFVPGGDPGHTEPAVMFACSSGRPRTSASSTRRRRCGCRRRASRAQWMETFYGLMAGQPAWLTGIVIGPQNRDSLATVRKRIPPQYKLRRYPDITHTIRAEYPVP